jgi:hypothetical protein
MNVAGTPPAIVGVALTCPKTRARAKKISGAKRIFGRNDTPALSSRCLAEDGLNHSLEPMKKAVAFGFRVCVRLRMWSFDDRIQMNRPH